MLQWDWDIQQIALWSSLAVVFVMILVFKNQKDRNKTKKTWKQYWGTTWDDFIGVIGFGQFMTWFREIIFTGYIFLFGSQDDWDWYYDIEEVIAALFGIFGMTLFILIYTVGLKKIASKFKQIRT